MKNNYMNRQGARQKSFMTMINEYHEVHNIHFFLVVEGESDEKFFKKFLDFNTCGVSNIGENDKGRDNNKASVLDFIEKQNKQNKKCYLGIIDADFDHVLHKDQIPANVVMTDYHDMEMLILNSRPNMSSIYAELANPILIKEYEKTNNKLFIDSIMNVAYEIGLLKLVCINKDKYHQLCTKDLNYSDCIDKMFNIDLNELISRVVRSNPRKGATEFEISNQISNEKNKNHDIYQICCGHDVTKILELCFTSKNGLGFGNEAAINPSRIESLLRAIYTADAFKKTAMYKSILEWEDKNKVKILDRKKIPD